MMLVTTACNMRCSYCYEALLRGRTGAMDTSMVRSAVDYFLRSSEKRGQIGVTFFGGEPLLNMKAISEAVALLETGAARLGKSVSFCLTTNGTLLNESIIEFIVDHDISVMVSLDGYREIHDCCRLFPNGEGTFSVVQRNIKQLLRKQGASGKQGLTIRSTLTRQFEDRYDGVYEYLASEFPGANVMIGCSLGHACKNGPWDVLPKTKDPGTIDAEFRRGLSEWIACRPDDLRGRLVEMPRTLANVRDMLDCRGKYANIPDLCGACRNMLAVDPGGSLYPCHRFVGDNQMIIGNLSRGRDENAIISFYRAYLASYEATCSRCWARILCGGDCPHYLSDGQGGIGLPSNDRCRILRGAFERSIALFSEVKAKRPDLLERWCGFP